MTPIAKFISKTPKSLKWLIVFFVDMVLLNFSTWLSYTLRLESWHLPNDNQITTYVISSLIFVVIFHKMGMYSVVFRYASLLSLHRLFLAICAYGGVFFVALYLLEIPTVPRAVGILQPIIFVIFCSSFRGCWLVYILDFGSNLKEKSRR